MGYKSLPSAAHKVTDLLVFRIGGGGGGGARMIIDIIGSIPMRVRSWVKRLERTRPIRWGVGGSSMIT